MRLQAVPVGDRKVILSRGEHQMREQILQMAGVERMRMLIVVVVMLVVRRAKKALHSTAAIVVMMGNEGMQHDNCTC